MKARASGKVERMEAEQALLPLKQQFDEWRGARRVGQRIPRQLWEAAAGAVALHGAYCVARVLGLDYAALKRRAAGQRTSALHFVELPRPQNLPPPAPAGEAACVIELANTRGATMRLQLRGQALAGLPALCQAFWGA
jgi:hypothetical protein